jgi:potassium/hydrogen antiporter
MATTVLVIGVALLAASLFIVVFRRTQVPDVLLLIGVGILLGPVTAKAAPEDFGKAGAAASTIALTIILFESGLSLGAAALLRSARSTLVLSGLSFAATVAIVTVVTTTALDLSWPLALATGATLGGTSSAVVIPLVRQLRLGELTTTVLVLESALTDVLCIVLTYAFLGAVLSGSTSVLAIEWSVLRSFGEAVVIGGAAALLLLLLVNAVRALPNAVVVLTAAVLITFGVAELLGASGAIASLALGFTLANRRALGITALPMFSHVQDFDDAPYLLRFLSDLVFILKTFFFIFLGISIRFSSWSILAWSLAAVLGAYAARLALVRITMNRAVSRYDASVASVMAPKGLAAAVLAGVPLQFGIAGGEAVQQFVYMVVLVSIVVTSVAIPLLGVPPMAWVMSRAFRATGGTS